MADPKSTNPAESAKPIATAAKSVKAGKPASVAKPAQKAGEPAAQTKAPASGSIATPAPEADKNPAQTSTPDEEPAPASEEIQRMISEAAYYLAEKRNFEPGFEDEDWKAAKAAVMEQIKASGPSEGSAN
jgi:hypothetical protein